MTETFGKLKALHNHSITPCGEDFDAMKSALQKYIRRGNVDKALQCLYEMDCFNYIDEKTAKANVTNLLHRLQIIFLEDIGVAGLSLLPSLQQCFKIIYDNREKRNKLTMFSKNWCDLRRLPHQA